MELNVNSSGFLLLYHWWWWGKDNTEQPCSQYWSNEWADPVYIEVIPFVVPFPKVCPTKCLKITPIRVISYAYSMSQNIKELTLTSCVTHPKKKWSERSWVLQNQHERMQLQQAHASENYCFLLFQNLNGKHNWTICC